MATNRGSDAKKEKKLFTRKIRKKSSRSATNRGSDAEEEKTSKIIKMMRNKKTAKFYWLRTAVVMPKKIPQ